MFERIGFPVEKLKRVRIAFLTDRGLESGRFRHLTPSEIARLKQWRATPNNDGSKDEKNSKHQAKR